ncbi:MAG: dienelactone hydrolase family protein [Geminicoccaceae bacterium]|nr:dienelactone hydrolase family protein [Geminicoccaceae bacterium]
MTEIRNTLSYLSAGKSYLGTVLVPPDAVPKGAVVLLPDWRGPSPLAFDHAAHLTGLGYAVAIADLYGDGLTPTNPEQVGPMVQHLLQHRRDGAEALASCIEALRAEVPPGTPVFCLGFSAGGLVALDHGRSGGDVSGIIVCSALLKTAEEGMDTRIAAPVLVVQGTEDQVSPMEVINALIAEMDDAGNDVRLLLFCQTHHAFDNPEAGNDPLARLCHSPVSAARSRAAIEAFLAEHTGSA